MKISVTFDLSEDTLRLINCAHNDVPNDADSCASVEPAGRTIAHQYIAKAVSVRIAAHFEHYGILPPQTPAPREVVKL